MYILLIFLAVSLWLGLGLWERSGYWRFMNNRGLLLTEALRRDEITFTDFCVIVVLGPFGFPVHCMSYLKVVRKSTLDREMWERPRR